MNICFTVLLLSFTMACSHKNTSQILSTKNNSAENKTAFVSQEKSATPVNCSEKYTIEVVDRAGEETRDINIVQDGSIRETLNIPTGRGQELFNGSSGAEKTEKGFHISIEWGTRYYWNKEFDFVCKGNGFYLTGITASTFDKHNPDKWKDKRHVVNVPLNKFEIRDHIKTEL